VSSLSAHLSGADDHGRLRFHPACPICREQRLIGSLSSDGLVSLRAQALLAAGLLVVSGAAPAAALAAEGDQEQDGTAAPQAGGDPATSPEFDPGGDSTDLPYDAPPVPEGNAPPDAGNPDTSGLDEEPTTDPGAPVADSGDGTDSPSEQPPANQAPESSPSESAPPEQPSPASSPPPAHVAPTTPPSEASPVAVGGKQQTTAAKSAGKHRKQARRQVIPATPSMSAPAAAAAPTVSVAQSRSTAVVGPAATGHHAQPGDRAHVVLPGESLWSIASDLLGGEASPAQIAREVHRLWRLNDGRIGTGDPNLLMVGTELRLR